MLSLGGGASTPGWLPEGIPTLPRSVNGLLQPLPHGEWDMQGAHGSE